MGPASTADCRTFAIGDGSPITSEIVKSGGWSGEDPDAAFYEAFFSDKHVAAPGGDVGHHARSRRSRKATAVRTRTISLRRSGSRSSPAPERACYSAGASPRARRSSDRSQAGRAPSEARNAASAAASWARAESSAGSDGSANSVWRTSER